MHKCKKCDCDSRIDCVCSCPCCEKDDGGLGLI